MADCFMRIVPLGRLQKGDAFDAYQIEIARRDKGKFTVTRYGHPDAKEMVVALLELLQSTDNVGDIV